MENETKKCISCGAEIPAGEAFCPECGAAVKAEEPAETPALAEETQEQPAEPLQQEEEKPAAESRKERKQREKEEARLQKEQARQTAKEQKEAARAARKAERKYRNIPAVIILSLIVAALAVGLGFLGWEHIGARSKIDSLTSENLQLGTALEDLNGKLSEKESQISSQKTEIEEKLDRITQGENEAEEFKARIAELEEQAEQIRKEGEDLLQRIAEKDPLGSAVSGSFRADRAVLILEDGETVPVTFSVLYGAKKTALDYTFEKGTQNIDTVSLSDGSIEGESALISIRARKKDADETALAVMKFTNDQSDDYFYLIIVVK